MFKWVNTHERLKSSTQIKQIKQRNKQTNNQKTPFSSLLLCLWLKHLLHHRMSDLRNITMDTALISRSRFDVWGTWAGSFQKFGWSRRRVESDFCSPNSCLLAVLSPHLSDCPLTSRQLLFRVILAYALCKSPVSQWAADAPQRSSSATEEYLSSLVIVQDGTQERLCLCCCLL